VFIRWLATDGLAVLSTADRSKGGPAKR